ncbi:MAG: cobyrinate a,c-diamide synthase [Deltaproteobacteria bacterium]|nr:cobyrinate a,c-diamide synthase [Deltaproteobacteria bacterium]
MAEPPRVVVAGLAGDTGKSLVTLGLARALRDRGARVAGFKKGPDFIDAAWLGAAAGGPGRNLDTFLMSEAAIRESVAGEQGRADVVLIEGNRGLFDGLDAAGTHSTAALAKLLRAPVVLVVDASKATRTVAALVLGCLRFDPELALRGVILNRIGTPRQLEVIRQAIAASTEVPVLGALPRLGGQPLPSRHLGLVTAMEHPGTDEVLEALGREVGAAVDLAALMAIARCAGPLPAAVLPASAGPGAAPGAVRIGVLRDRAFSFYYPENLAALEQAGAELVFLSPLADGELPPLDGLYAGGGFPEIYAAELAANRAFREALAARIAAGLPVWAECGGLAYLARSLRVGGAEHRMVGALPIVVEQTGTPQGHGYVRARVDAGNPFLPPGTELRGHEFHYSRLAEQPAGLTTALAVERGRGVGGGRDGIVVGQVLATYTHLHALGTPQWAPALVGAARSWRSAEPAAVPARRNRTFAPRAGASKSNLTALPLEE